MGTLPLDQAWQQFDQAAADLRIALAVVGEARRAQLSAGSEGGRACLDTLRVAVTGLSNRSDRA